jgi:hypothetical protein
MFRTPRRRPSAALTVALLALVISLAGTAFAGTIKHLINGSTIKPHSIAGSKLKKNTLTGVQINESKLGTVPHAALADSATAATTAATAANAANASALGGAPASAYFPASKVLRWNFAMTKGAAAHTLTFGPLTFTATCAADTTKTDAKLAVSTSEDGTFVSNAPDSLGGPPTLINKTDSYTIVEVDTALADDGDSKAFTAFDPLGQVAVFSSATTIGVAINSGPGADCRFFGYLINDA